MLGLDLSDDEDQGTVFRDVLMLVLFGFVTIVVLILPHLNPPEAAADATPPGNVVVEMRWPDDIDADVDLWVQAPGDTPVGYSNKSARYFNLLRDDLGKDNETTGLNFEVAFSRGTPAGEYTVNAHLYRNQSARTPIEVVVAWGRRSRPCGSPSTTRATSSPAASMTCRVCCEAQVHDGRKTRRELIWGLSSFCTVRSW